MKLLLLKLQYFRSNIYYILMSQIEDVVLPLGIFETLPFVVCGGYNRGVDDSMGVSAPTNSRWTNVDRNLVATMVEAMTRDFKWLP
jgi:hypothetical protein